MLWIRILINYQRFEEIFEKSPICYNFLRFFSFIIKISLQDSDLDQTGYVINLPPGFGSGSVIQITDLDLDPDPKEIFMDVQRWIDRYGTAEYPPWLKGSVACSKIADAVHELAGQIQELSQHHLYKLNIK